MSYAPGDMVRDIPIGYPFNHPRTHGSDRVRGLGMVVGTRTNTAKGTVHLVLWADGSGLLWYPEVELELAW
jgi:hypothetical protein